MADVRIPHQQVATELAWLKWFCIEADFGPADGDVRMFLKERFEEETGTLVPKGWRYDE
jgi:hypothetical protein